MFRRHRILLGLMVAGVGIGSATAQWVTQSIALQAGWNAVYLEVQPEPADCDNVFAGLPVESVWAWNERFSTVQFIQDPNELLPGQPNWLAYLPPDHPARVTRNLFSIRGGQAYLIKLKPGVDARSWLVVGQPVVRAPEWLSDSYNLVGFPIAPNRSPTFQSFFAGSAAHAGKPAYRLNPAGQWVTIGDAATTGLSSGKAYWVYCQGASTFSGPVQLGLDSSDGLIYGRTLMEQTLRIRNRSTSPASITIRAVSSLSPPTSSSPVLAGPVPLAYFRIDAAENEFGWFAVTGSLQSAAIPPGQEWVLRLGANRSAMADFTPPATHSGVLYQSLLEIADGTGVRYLVPVSAEGLQSYPSSVAAIGSQSVGLNDVAPPPDPRAGLWVGTASIIGVNRPSNTADPDRPVPTAAPFEFRLIVHVDDAGQARMLQKVLLMFKPGTLKPDPTNPEFKVVDQLGRFVLVTDDALISRFSGATLRDGQPVARRLSSPAFGFTTPIEFLGAGEFGAGTLSCEVAMGYDDPLNPFKHVYHPDHDNLNDRFESKVPEGIESFSVMRRIELEFTPEDPDRLAIAGWGDNQLGGIFRETVIGLQQYAIHTQGTFRLTQASRIGVLNDGL